MAAASIGSALVVFFFALLTEIEAGEYCRNYYGYNSYYNNYYQTYCVYGCCGSYHRQYCCDAGAWIIVLGIIGSIIFVSVIVAVVCCCLKKQSHAGRVVHPSNSPGANNNRSHVTVVYTGTSGQYPGAYPMGPVAGPAGPPPYKRFENPPPAYSHNNPPGTALYSDAAYPPPPPPSSSAAPSAPSASSAAPPPPGFSFNGSSSSSGGAPPGATRLPPLPPQ